MVCERHTKPWSAGKRVAPSLRALINPKTSKASRLFPARQTPSTTEMYIPTSLVVATTALLASVQAAAIYKPALEALIVSTPASLHEATELTPRGSFKGVGCDDITMGKSDTDAAVTNLVNQCRGTTQSIYSYNGDTVAFYCQWHPGPQCLVDSANYAFDMITDQCGLYGAGSYSNDNEKDRNYSYGYTNWRVHDYCGVPAGTRIHN